MNETSLSRLPSLREAGSRSEAEGSSAEAEISTEESATSGFRVNLEVYSGPFDALLGMIANNRLELTEVSLSSITEEFLTYVRGLDFTKNMDEASAFLDIASILVEAKSVAILPGGEDSQHDEQSLEVLRERDLLFARLLQYRAYKQAAGDFRARIAANSGRFPHPAAMDEGVAAMLPELVWTCLLYTSQRRRLRRSAARRAVGSTHGPRMSGRMVDFLFGLRNQESGATPPGSLSRPRVQGKQPSDCDIQRVIRNDAKN